jgi:hypothetical protein
MGQIKKVKADEERNVREEESERGDNGEEV